MIKIAMRPFRAEDELIDILGQSIPYREKEDKDKYDRKWGQLKLFITLLQFIVRYVSKSDKTPVIIYVGAAPGFNIVPISKMFPSIEFHLYDRAILLGKKPDGNDPVQIIPWCSKLVECTNITIHNKYFDSSDISYWKEKKENFDIYFVSDIRSLSHRMGADKPKNMTPMQMQKYVQEQEIIEDKTIRDDLRLQASWVKDLLPIYSQLKFRLPFYSNEPVAYFDGEIYSQPWIGMGSSETRLVVKKDFTMKEYLPSNYNNVMMYHNTKRRKMKFENPFSGNTDMYDPAKYIFNFYDDALTFKTIYYYFVRIGRNNLGYLYMFKFWRKVIEDIEILTGHNLKQMSDEGKGVEVTENIYDKLSILSKDQQWKYHIEQAIKRGIIMNTILYNKLSNYLKSSISKDLLELLMFKERRLGKNQKYSPSPSEWLEQNKDKYVDQNEKVRNMLMQATPVNYVDPSIFTYFVLNKMNTVDSINVYDPDMRWGEILSAALTFKNCFYYGKTVNKAVETKLNDMIDIFSNRDSYMINREESDIDDKLFNLFIYSSPIYDEETYDCKDIKEKYETLDLWRQKHLTPLISEGLKKLEKGGYFLFYLNNFSHYFDYIKEYVQNLTRLFNIKKSDVYGYTNSLKKMRFSYVFTFVKN
jgi:hypothetical protein